MTMKMKALLLTVVFLSLSLLACSTTKITNTWQDENYSGKPFANILVIGQFLDEEVCRMSELPDHLQPVIETGTVHLVREHSGGQWGRG